MRYIATALPVIATLVALTFGAPARAQTDPGLSQEAARAALAVLGVGAIPNDTLGAFNVLSASGEATDFLSSQVGGGFHIKGDRPIYLEGFLGVQQYNPRIFLPRLRAAETLDVLWSSTTMTGGVGWDVDLPAGWVFRPMAHVTLGYVFSDAIFDQNGPLPPLPLPPDEIEDAVQGGLLAGGVGASLGLLQRRDFGAWDVEIRLRHAHLELFPIGAPEAGAARANAIKSSAFSRFRRDIPNWTLGGGQVRSVFDASAGYYFDDQAKVLGTDWLATVGAGLEVDARPYQVPYVSAGRVMLSYVFGEGYEGFSVGFGLSF